MASASAAGRASAGTAALGPMTAGESGGCRASAEGCVGIGGADAAGWGVAAATLTSAGALPDSLSAAVGLRKAGHSPRWILGLWLAVAAPAVWFAGASVAAFLLAVVFRQLHRRRVRGSRPVAV